MGEFLAAAIAVLPLLLVSLLQHGTVVVDASKSREAQDFLARCPPSRCSQDGPEVRFPLRLEHPGGSSNSSSSCGASCARLACSGRDTVLLHPFLGRCNVTAIDYARGTLSATLPSPGCPTLNKLMSMSTRAIEATSDCGLSSFVETKLLVCSSEWPFAPGSDDFVSGPIHCADQRTFSYLANADVSIAALPLGCKVASPNVIPIFGLPIIDLAFDDLDSDFAQQTFRRKVEGALGYSEMVAYWGNSDNDIIIEACINCERDGQLCAFNSETEETFCTRRPNPGSRVKVIAATTSVVALVVLLSMVATALYIFLKKRYNEEVHLKVEMFLKTYGTSKPTRYSFSEVKKIGRRFKDFVGQGGFGSVYKGALPNGVPVAVKMIENSTGEGEEFISEVGTIGLIHHANIVRLMGFCSEGTRRALIYEFMPNESLEKYIFPHASNISQQLLAPKQMLDIALGIARGMEYLHQGCNQRILHFDIKPHNILLDHDFNPKISDFGLAKLCARDQSIITLITSRGTMGYIAPEVFSRHFGDVSYKSDVYSFGMLVLEMVSGRRNSDPSIDSRNEVYLPEWIYEKVDTGQEWAISSEMEMNHEEKEKMREMVIVALLCIQWNPRNRPSMTKVVNMLTGRLQNLQMPPKPFITSRNHPMP